MGFEALLSFLGGAAFRSLLNSVLTIWTTAQDHKHELAMLEMQDRLDERRRTHELAMAEVAHKQGVEVIRVRGEADLQRTDAEAFVAAMRSFNQRTGIFFVDLWNGIVRPAFATLCLFLLLRHFAALDWKLDSDGFQLIGAVIGYFFADRTLFRSRQA